VDQVHLNALTYLSKYGHFDVGYFHEGCPSKFMNVTMWEHCGLKKAEFVSDRMPYVILRDHWYVITVLNVRFSTKDTVDYVKDDFCEELQLYSITSVRRFQCQSNRIRHF
jgi:hypothetical protein